MIKCLANDKMYIGQSTDIEKRWYEHKKRLNRNNHINNNLQNDWNIYGEDNFKFEIIIECTIDELDELEISYIKKYNTYENGYNYTIGGKGSYGYKHSEETKELLREMRLGTTLTEETKEKLSKSHKGENNHLYGKNLTEETKKKISDSLKGNTHTEETKKKISETLKNNPPNNLKLICIFPNGDTTEPMLQKDLAKYLNLNVSTVRKIVKTGKPYKPTHKNKKYLEGIIIKAQK